MDEEGSGTGSGGDPELREHDWDVHYRFRSSDVQAIAIGWHDWDRHDAVM